MKDWNLIKFNCIVASTADGSNFNNPTFSLAALEQMQEARVPIVGSPDPAEVIGFAETQTARLESGEFVLYATGEILSSTSPDAFLSVGFTVIDSDLLPDGSVNVNNATLQALVLSPIMQDPLGTRLRDPLPWETTTTEDPPMRTPFRSRSELEAFLEEKTAPLGSTLPAFGIKSQSELETFLREEEKIPVGSTPPVFDTPEELQTFIQEEDPDDDLAAILAARVFLRTQIRIQRRKMEYNLRGWSRYSLAADKIKFLEGALKIADLEYELLTPRTDGPDLPLGGFGHSGEGS